MLRLTLILTLAALSMMAQLNSFTQTTLAAAATQTASTLRVTSATNIVARTSYLYVIPVGAGRGELMQVTSVSGTNIGVSRGLGGTMTTGLPSGSVVLIAPGFLFETYDPQGSCVLAQTKIQPWVNTNNGRQWICSPITNTWVPGWQNDLPVAPTATVASAAGPVVPSGPFFTISGTAAITGFTRPVGFSHGGFCVMPSGAFTTTTATNIAAATTAVVGRTLCFTYNSATDRYHPSY